jgi:hypothetical protein
MVGNPLRRFRDMARDSNLPAASTRVRGQRRKNLPPDWFYYGGVRVPRTLTSPATLANPSSLSAYAVQDANPTARHVHSRSILA